VSIELLRQIPPLALPRPQKEILRCLADHANGETGRCDPSVPFMAWETDYSERQVQRILGDLKAAGIVEALERPGETPWYVLHLDRAPQKAPFVREGRKARRARPGGDKTSPLTSVGRGDTATSPPAAEGVTKRHPGGDTAMAPEPEVNLKEHLPPSVVAAPPLEPPTAAAAANQPAPTAGEVVPLRSGRAMAAANGVLERLKAEAEAGRRSWSFTDAAKAEWDALLDDDRNLSTAQQFLVWYVAQNRGVDIRTLDRLDWSMAGQKVNRWRSLALYGVDQAVTRNLTGLDFWKYAEKVCQAASAELRQGTP
jgi:hypothetical protein